LRPDVVWFGEALAPAQLERTMEFIRGGARAGRLVFLAVGTSGSVYPAAGLVEVVGRAGGESWLLNAERAENTERFDHFVRGRATETLPPLVGTTAAA
jgi:NAD-dependent deacetylase